MLASASVQGELDGAAGGARAKRGGEDLLDVATYLRGAEALDGAPVAQAREEIRHAVALVGGERRRLDRVGGARRRELNAARPDGGALADEAGLLHDQRPRVAVHGEREGGLRADLRPRPLEKRQRARIAEHDQRVVLGLEAGLAQVRGHRGDRRGPAEDRPGEDPAVSAIVDERAPAVARAVVEPVAELGRAAELAGAGMAAPMAELDGLAHGAARDEGEPVPQGGAPYGGPVHHQRQAGGARRSEQGLRTA